MIDLRAILSRYRVEWRDYGPNTSKGAVNVQCPLCGNQDPSFHCRIFEQLSGWYCLRNSKHHGSVFFLFKKLGIPTEGLPEYKPGSWQPTTKPIKEIDYAPFERFSSALESKEMLEYLRFRKFLFPEEVILKFGLRYTPLGKWACRIIIPLSVGWTGRSVRSCIGPRYLSETNEAGFFLHGKGLSAVLVEGPLDAMKLAAVEPNMVFIAMTGGFLSPSIIYFLREKQIQRLYVNPDESVLVSQRVALMRDLRTYCPTIQVTDVHLPEGTKDSGEMTEDEARQWIYSLPV